MQNYPARNISTADGQVNVLQITDLHLSDIARCGDVRCCHQRFEAVLAQALAEPIRCDLILVTGDLVSKIQPHIYDHIFSVLDATTIPFACIAGNHDVTDERDSTVPFSERTLVAKVADARLLNQHAIVSEHWQILLIDSSVPGKISGELADADIAWLDAQLTACPKPALIALHHHIIPMQSAWIDVHIAKNVSPFWQQLRAHPQVKAIVSGHTHQEKVYTHNGVTVYSTPSTCYQFKPLVDDFAYDEQAKPGWRWLQLANNGQVASWVKRLDT
ncbi:metallophosphoesterase [Psychrobacter aestuarii]|uniref:3',5'-cyclic-AMP phosphodiesterase n=1 Tax=Psychrobacter aestuarii TaxID=556327 RepID=A0ABP3FTP9_9GAMM|nr:metallophosphoesterase [Psychrobacter aestuarii]